MKHSRGYHESIVGRQAQCSTVPRRNVVACMLLLLSVLIGNVATKQRRRAIVPTIVQTVYQPGFSTPHPELCPTLGANVTVAILVHSAPANAKARRALRLSWASDVRSRTDVAFGFLIGHVQDPKLASALVEEDQLYGDLVRGLYIDSYENLTLKTLSALQWVSTYCPRARWLFKTDDDTFVNVVLLLSLAESLPADAMWGEVLKWVLPKRRLSYKYRMPPEQWPLQHGSYPPYTQGLGYLLPASWCERMLSTAMSLQFMRLEDVFIGVTASKLGLPRCHVNNFRYWPESPISDCVLQKTVVIHNVSFKKQVELWNKINRPNLCVATSLPSTPRRSSSQMATSLKLWLNKIYQW